MECSSFFVGLSYHTKIYYHLKLQESGIFGVQDLSQPSFYQNKTKMRLCCPLTSMYVGLLIANCKYGPKAKQVIINRMTMDKDEVAPDAAKTKCSY